MTVTLREIANGMGVYATDPGFTDLIEQCTVLAMGLGYGPMAAGTGGAYADHTVSGEDAEIIVDMITNTDQETGVYTGDRDAISALAAEGADESVTGRE